MNRLRRLALASVTFGVILVAAAYLATWAGRVAGPAVWAMILGIALQLGGMTVLGGSHAGPRRKYVTVAALFLAAVIVIGFGSAVLLPPPPTESPSYFLGLPLRAAIVLLGVGILPFFVLPFLYAADFDETGLDDASLDRLREECRSLRDARNVEEPR